jgi:glycosyltransferase involved in cell wall biosynthesis
VLIVVQNLPLVFDRRVRMECQALVEAGHHVSVICPRAEGEPAQFELDGVQVYTYEPPPSTSGVLSYVLEFAYCWLRTSLLSLTVRRREGFGVLQACNPPDTYWLLALLWRARHVRFVYDQHDLCPEVYRARFGRRGLLHKALLLLEQASYRVADQVISTNESYREIATRRGHRRPEQSTVVMSAPDPTVMRPGDPDPSLRNGRRYLCTYVGIMGPQDGVDRLLHAIDAYVHVLGRDDCHFALLGFGDCLPELKELAAELGIEPWVTFTGRVGQEEIGRWLSSSDLGVTPDPMCEFNDRSSMNKTLEYMAHGLPQVAFDLTETRRSAGMSAVYVEEDEDKAFAVAIADLLDDPVRRRIMGRAGRQRIESTLSWQRQSPAYVSIFDRLLGRAPRTVDLRAVSANEPHIVDLRNTIVVPAQRIPSLRLGAEVGEDA